MAQKFPEAIHIGLKRSGSTLLRHYYSSHPQIDWSRKGIYFLNEELYRNTSYQEYLNLPKRDKIHIDMHEHLGVGMIMKDLNMFEKLRFRVGYRDYQNYLNVDPILVANRIADTVPNAKILMVIRNQIDWLACHYRNFVHFLPRKRQTFGDFLTTFEGKLVTNGGVYHHTIQCYYKLFGRENVLVLVLEEIRNDLQGQLDRLCEFLDIGKHSYMPENSHYHRGRTNFAARVIYRMRSIGIPERVMELLKGLVKPVSDKMEGVWSETLDRFILSSSEIKFLEAYYSASNYATSELLQVDLKSYDYPF